MLKRFCLGFLSLIFGVGILASPAALTVAQAAATVTICNSPSSGPNPYGSFRVIDTSRGYSFTVTPGNCVTVTNTTYLRVDRFGYPTDQPWRVRSVPGTYGSCHWGASNPGSGDKYSYLVGYDPTNC